MFWRCWRWCYLLPAHIQTNTHRVTANMGPSLHPTRIFHHPNLQEDKTVMTHPCRVPRKTTGLSESRRGEKGRVTDFGETLLCTSQGCAHQGQDHINTWLYIFPACYPNLQDLNSMEVSGSVNCHVRRFPAGSVGCTNWEIFPELTPVLGTSCFL